MAGRILTCMAVLLTLGRCSTADEIGRVRESAEYKCRLALPGPDFEWLDHTQIPEAQAALANGAGTILVFLAKEAPPHFVLDHTFIKGFDETFVQPGVTSKLDGEITTFRNTPCYTIHGRLEVEDLFVTNRCFAANGYLYIVQLISVELPSQDNNLDEVFSAFEFVGTPQITKPRSSEEQRAYETGRLIGQILGYCIIGAIGFGVVKRLICGKKKTAAVENSREPSVHPEHQEPQ